MILAGDERGRTQGGNNNAYCHDTPRTWLHWDDDWLGELVTRLIALRAARSRCCGGRRFLAGDQGDGSPVDVRWLGPDGPASWTTSGSRTEVRTLGMHLDGRAPTSPATRCCWCSTPTTSRAGFTLPDGPFTVLLDSADAGRAGPGRRRDRRRAWSVVVLRDEP